MERCDEWQLQRDLSDQGTEFVNEELYQITKTEHRDSQVTVRLWLSIINENDMHGVGPYINVRAI